MCDIAHGKTDVAKIWEDDNFLAVLDINPNTRGMTLVLTKDHHDSYAFDMPDAVYQQLMLASKKVAKILKKGLGVKRVAMVMEGLGINHVHIKLYPLHGLSKKYEDIFAEERIFFDKYEGYVSTQLGPVADLADLKKLAEEIKRKCKLQ